MDSIFKPLKSHALILLATFVLFFLPCVRTSSNNTSLVVYTKCANPTQHGPSSDDESHSQVLSSLFQQLSAQSYHSKFFKATAGDETVGISGLFQCRGDISSHECYNCVNTLPAVSNNMCKQAVAARVQLHGCYFRYETDGFVDWTLNYELHHETCSEKKAVGGGFVEIRDAAFLAMQGEEMNSEGYNEVDYEYVHVVAQCEGGLGNCDCSECVGIAAQIAKEDCGSSVSGEVYLDMCFVSYTYNPEGAPDKEGEHEDNTKRTIAIVLGGATALGAGFTLVTLMRRRSED